MANQILAQNELRALRLTADGVPNEQIAKIMGITLEGVHTLHYQIRQETGIETTPAGCKAWIQQQLAQARAPKAGGVYNTQEPTRSQLECLVLYAQGFDFTHIATALDYSHIQSPQNAVSLACKRLGISTGKHKRRRALVRAWLEKKGLLAPTSQAVTMDDDAF